eukprot:scaffold66207_cov31-Tisochrysis_lutea.AAC.1
MPWPWRSDAPHARPRPPALPESRVTHICTPAHSCSIAQRLTCSAHIPSCNDSLFRSRQRARPARTQARIGTRERGPEGTGDGAICEDGG